MHCRIFGLAVLAATTVTAQWLHYPTPGIPRTRDGKPNLAARAPKNRDHKPDLSGLWLPEDDKSTKGSDGESLPKLFIDISNGLKPAEFSMQPWAQTLLTERDGNFQADDPITRCKPVGGPRLNYIPTPIKVVHNSNLIVFMHEYETTFRQIYTDGRKLPEDPEPSALGYSTGKWDRDVLVVDTVGFRDRGWLDAIGHPYSDALHLTERFQRRDFGHIELQITINDPKAYRDPFTVRQIWAFLPDTDLLEYHCADNERDVRHFVLK